MGAIHIDVLGSFKPNAVKSFSALEHGHAQAVADAIQWLTNNVLPKAIANDHKCQQQNVYPDKGFGKPDAEGSG